MKTRVYARIEIFGFWEHMEVFMREKYIEQKLIKAVKATGGLALKFMSPGYNGYRID